MSESRTFEGWAILELMGHRKLAGRISEANIGGGAFIRIDVPGEAADVATQFYAPGAVYCITPCTEDVARRTAAGCRPSPVTEYELAPARRLPAPPDDADDADDDCWEEAVEASTEATTSTDATPTEPDPPRAGDEPF